ncbi:hypothetical protein FHS14_004347 [Paenibacillus baekrokdamisoli]|nr:hypothetical protein [Paenibacillus baekrokdamisoli]MBB3071338.1 hypothetical protein [Paenibacillus baekrokdamisoli]
MILQIGQALVDGSLYEWLQTRYKLRIRRSVDKKSPYLLMKQPLEHH